MSNVPIGTLNQRPEFDVAFDEFEQMPEEFGFVGLKTLTPIEVSRRSGTFYTRPAKEKLRDGYTKRRPDGSFNRLQRRFDETDYATRRISLEERLDDERAEMFPDYDAAEADTVQDLWDTIQREIESSITAKLQNTSTFEDAAVEATWQNHSSAEPLTDLTNAKLVIHAQSGLQANTVVMGYEAFNHMLLCDQVIERIKFWGGNDPNLMTMAQNLSIIAKALGVQRLLVAGAVFDDADFGQEADFTTFWDSDKVGVYRCAIGGGSIRQSCVGRSFVFPSKGSGASGDKPVLSTVSYREEATESDIYRSDWYMDDQIINPNAGFILTGANQAVGG